MYTAESDLPAQSLLFAVNYLLQQLSHFSSQSSQQDCQGEKFLSNNQKIIQLNHVVDAVPLLSWLSCQTQYPRIYWQGRDTEQEVAAIGEAKKLQFEDEISDSHLAEIYHQQKSFSDDLNVRYYGGVAFDRTIPSWPEFGRAHFVLPRIELRRAGSNYNLSVNLNFADNSVVNECNLAALALQQLILPSAMLSPSKARLLARQDIPDFARWQDLVQQVTDKTFNISTPKVVLSRCSSLSINQDIDPWMVLACWQGRNQNSFQFGFQFSPERTFISCSPERLYRRQRRELYTEALAGTTIRGLTQEEDQILAEQLLDDSKNSNENQLVRQHIVQMLEPLSLYVGADESPRIFKLMHIQHLHRSIRAELKPCVDDFQLLQALHPTPAVGGLPREAAMDFIRNKEGYTRGWYAGACGYLNKHESEFSVAIRSALFEPNRINLYAGAGIVAGSNPALEWQELENKLATIMSILIDF